MSQKRPADRRSRRSSDPLVALHYQLSHARKIGALETIVIADDSGVVVAGSGSWAACEELAAYAPFLQDRSDASSSRISSLRDEALVKRLSVGSSTIIVCAKGSKDRDAARSAVDQASAGAVRILAA